MMIEIRNETSEQTNTRDLCPQNSSSTRILEFGDVNAEQLDNDSETKNEWTGVLHEALLIDTQYSDTGLIEEHEKISTNDVQSQMEIITTKSDCSFIHIDKRAILESDENQSFGKPSYCKSTFPDPRDHKEDLIGLASNRAVQCKTGRLFDAKPEYEESNIDSESSGILYWVKTMTVITPEVETEVNSEPFNNKQTIIEAVRKAGVAVAGGTMVGVGVVMIPLPTPFGIAVAGAGMAVLGTEFPAAQQALDSTRDALVDVLEKHCDHGSYDNKSESDVATENIGDSVRRTLQEMGQKALPMIRAMGTQTPHSA